MTRNKISAVRDINLHLSPPSSIREMSHDQTSFWNCIRSDPESDPVRSPIGLLFTSPWRDVFLNQTANHVLTSQNKEHCIVLYFIALMDLNYSFFVLCDMSSMMSLTLV